MGFGWGNLYVTARFCLLQKPQVETPEIAKYSFTKYGRLIVVNFHDKYNYRPSRQSAKSHKKFGDGDRKLAL